MSSSAEVVIRTPPVSEFERRVTDAVNEAFAPIEGLYDLYSTADERMSWMIALGVCKRQAVEKVVRLQLP